MFEKITNKISERFETAEVGSSENGRGTDFDRYAGVSRAWQFSEGAKWPVYISSP